MSAEPPVERVAKNNENEAEEESEINIIWLNRKDIDIIVGKW